MLFSGLRSFAKEVGDAFASGLRGDSDRMSAPTPEIHVDVASNRPAGFTSLECPKCGGAIQVPADQATCYCAYCGAQLHLDDGAVNITYRMVDETKIRELEAKAAVELKRMEIEEKYRPIKIKACIVLAIIGAALLFVATLLPDAGYFGYALVGIGIVAFYAVMIIGLSLFGSNEDGKT